MSLQDLTNKEIKAGRLDEVKKEQSPSICEECLAYNELIFIIEKALLDVAEQNTIMSTKEKDLLSCYQDCTKIEEELTEQVQCLNKVNSIKL